MSPQGIFLWWCLGTSSLGLAACSSGDRASAAPFVVLMDAAPGSLDPRFAMSDYGAKISNLIFSGLVTIDTPTGEWALDLATDVRMVTDVVYEVSLRTDAVFHDGHPVTAADVVFTFSQLDEVGSPWAGDFEQVLVEALADHAVRFTLPEPNARFINSLALGVVPEHRLASPEEGVRELMERLPPPLPSLWDSSASPERGLFPPGVLVGSGPFRLVSQRGEHEISVEANPHYHNGPPLLPAVVFRLVRDDNARILSVLSGSADLVQNAIPQLMLPVIERYDNLVLRRAPSFKYTYMVFNLRHEVLSDIRVRQAISHAIDRREIIRHKFRGMATLSTGLLAPDHWAYEGDVRDYDYDPERARALLDEAGYPEGANGEPRFTIVFKVASNRFRRSIAMLIAHQLGAVGIEVEVLSYEWGTFFADVRSGNFEIATLMWPNILDPDHYHYIFHSDSIPMENHGRGANRGSYVNHELDDLIEDGRRSLDLEHRRRIYSRIQQIVAEEAPYVSLWHEDNYVVHSRAVVGYEMVPNARFTFLAQTARGGN